VSRTTHQVAALLVLVDAVRLLARPVPVETVTAGAQMHPAAWLAMRTDAGFVPRDSVARALDLMVVEGMADRVPVRGEACFLPTPVGVALADTLTGGWPCAFVDGF
jgi:hypothetical protein